MPQEPLPSSKRRPPNSADAVPGSTFDASVLVTCNPCLGLPPMVIPSPGRYVATQVLVGVAAVTFTLLFGGRP
jgi:hypothetical protein